MSPKLKKLLIIVSIALIGCCFFSAALAILVPSDEEPVARQVAEVSQVVEGAAEQDWKPAATHLPPSPPATATEPSATTVPTKTLEPATSTPTHTRPPTNTPAPTNTRRPTSTPRPTNTPTPLATPTLPSTPTATPLPTATSLPGEIATVIGVIDGDTIIVDLNGVTWRVRYIGIDTPESGQLCGSEATSANKSLVDGKTIRMVKDVNETDRYGRLLRYVYVGNVFVNRELVADGWAEAVDYPPDTAMSSVLHAAASEGVDRGCSLVAGALPTVPPRAPVVPVVPVVPIAPQPTSPPAVQPTSPPADGNCHPSYPTVCIAPPPPDLDCGQIPHRRFQVVGDDPHNFDGDHDGIGCESG